MSETEDYSRAGAVGIHATTHEDAGSDEISVLGLAGLLADDQHVLDAEVKLIKLDDFATPDDNTDLDASITKHGLLPKLNNVATQYLNGQGGWSEPPDTTTPDAHKASHQDTGSDEISVLGLAGLLADDQHVLDAEVKLIKLDDFATPDDNTDLNASTSKHGLLPKLDNIATNYLNGQGGWSEPPDTTTPDAHKASHQDTGSDELSVLGLSGLLADDQHVLDAEVKLIKLDDFATPDDNTDLNASTSKHGLLPKLDNIATNYLNGQGGWSEPPDTTTPDAHKASHQDTGSDELSVTGLSGLLADDQHVLDAEVKLIKLDDFATPDDNTDLDASITKHGLLRKLSNVVTEFLNGQGGWTEPPGGAELPLNFISGLVLSIDADTEHDINITAGAARDATDSEDIILASEITKRIDASWSVGDDQGGLDTGSVANNTLYALWLIKRSDTNVEDVLFSASFSSPTMPTDYDYKRLIGWILTDGSANIRSFRTYGRGNIVEYWFTARQQIATGLNQTSLTAQAVNSVFPTVIFNVLGIYYGVIASSGEIAFSLGYDTTNVLLNINPFGSSNTVGSFYAIGKNNQPFFLPPNGNNVSYLVSSLSATLYGIACRIYR